MKIIRSVVLSFFLFLPFVNANAQDSLSYLNKAQREKLADEIFNGIERLDAITIELRNNTRSIDWEAYKTLSKANIVEATDWNSLYHALDNLHYGIINRHSYVLVAESIASQVTKFNRWPQFEIGYSWPEIEFFALDNNKNINTINGKKISVIFEQFYNLYCNGAHHSDCLKLFSEYLASGYSFLNNLDTLLVEFDDESQHKITKAPATKNQKPTTKTCDALYTSLDAKLIYDGSQSCLFETQSAYILKILFFGGWGTSSDNIHCKGELDNGMCKDIHSIATVTQSKKSKPMIIDLQDNGGGSENTPWVAALTRHGFKENLVAYRNLTLLNDDEIRHGAFYGIKAAERWYQSLTESDKSSKKAFLPARVDFCQGSKNCAFETIPSSPTPINYTDLKIISNGKCVSSCDDLIWRTSQYAKAKTYGQLPATDGAYARLNAHVFMTQDGEIETVVTGEGSSPDLGNGTLLLHYRIPVTKTVDTLGNNLEGNTNYLDYPLPITKDNFRDIAEDNVRRVLNLL